MRVAILADIHGNSIQLAAVVKDAQSAGCEAFLVAGDHLPGGPDPAGVADQLMALPVLHSILGNRDHYLLRYTNGRAGDYQGIRWAMLRWSAAELSAPQLDWLAHQADSQRLTLAGLSIRLCHGSPRRIDEFLIPEDQPRVVAAFHETHLLPAHTRPTPLADGLGGAPEDLVICGHTHIPWQARRGSQWIVNPGSVGQPIHGDWRAQYCVLEIAGSAVQSLEQRGVPYDREALREQYRQNNLIELDGGFARASLAASLTGRNIVWFFVEYMQQQARQAGFDRTIPDQFWATAGAGYPWPAGT